MLAFVGLAWAPLVAIELVVLVATGRFDRIFESPSVHARLVVAIPMFLVAEVLFDARTSMCIRRLQDGRMVGPEEGDRLRTIVRRAAGRRDSAWVEAVLLMAAIASGQVAVWRGHTGIIGHYASGISPGLVWYGFVSLPVFLFLLYRWIWRWGSWGLMLSQVARLRLRLIPTHPDRTGGLGFLTGPIVPFGLVLFGANAVIAATFAARMVVDGASLRSFGPEVLVLLFGGELLALGPLVFLYRRLVSDRFSGVVRYGGLAFDYGRLFDRRWVESGDTDGLLGTSDIQSMADIQNAYRGLEEMRLVPFGRHEVLVVAILILLPMVPLVAIEFPIDELLARLVSSIV